MAARDSSQSGAARGASGWWLGLLLAAAVALWALDRFQPEADRTKPAPRSPASASVPADSAPVIGSGRLPATTGGYETYRNCTLAAARNNDGDSFMVRLPDGRRRELRLYFVDTPESAFKRYANGETNHERIRQQAAEMGGITPEQAVEIGKQGKAFTLALLESRPFTVFTVWDSPYQDERFHAFIEVDQAGRHRWLHELLIERGLARLKTKPADLPDGTAAATHRQRLKVLETAAKRARAGVWGL